MLALIVAPVGADPFGPDASTPLDVEALPVAPPAAWLERSSDAGVSLAVAVTGAAGTLVTGDLRGRDARDLIAAFPGEFAACVAANPL